MHMQTNPLGKHGLEISRLGLGCMGMSALYGATDEAESVRALERALEIGISFWDTSDIY
ncbi:MAG: aldo/keto reductase, partial [Pseudomonadales bacterium]